ncbi:hypothetical protein D9M69_565140 [compost metagenome]
MLFARDVSSDIPIWQVCIDLVPLGVWIVNQLAVYDELGSKSLVNVNWSKFPIWAVRIGCKYDAVIAETNFLNFLDASVDARLEFSALHGARCIGDIDGVFTDALAEFLDACTRAARFNNRRLEVRIGFAKGFCNDLGIRQNGRGTGNLNLIARIRSGNRQCCSNCERCGRGNHLVHEHQPLL